MSTPKTLFLDIETSPIQAMTWGIYDVTIGLNQIKKHSSIIAWAAKWRGEKEMHYLDQRGKKDAYDDKALLKPLWALLNEADIIITQNGKKFDERRINARFIINGFPPPSPYQHLDTKQMAKRHFGFTSNRLEYLADTLNKKNRKQKHKKFPGFDLWTECLNGNLDAWKEMEHYNKADVLALEELFERLAPWDRRADAVSSDAPQSCSCGSTRFKKNGVRQQKSGTFQNFACTSCGAHYQRRISTRVLSSGSLKRA